MVTGAHYIMIPFRGIGEGFVMINGLGRHRT